MHYLSLSRFRRFFYTCFGIVLLSSEKNYLMEKAINLPIELCIKLEEIGKLGRSSSTYKLEDLLFHFMHKTPSFSLSQKHNLVSRPIFSPNTFYMGRGISLSLSIAYNLSASLSFLHIRTNLVIEGLSSFVSFVFPLSLSLFYVTQANTSKIITTCVEAH